jgi:hypothetical protein
MAAYIESIVTETLRQRYIAGLDLIRELAQSTDIEQLNIVTLNHDTLVEQFLLTNGIEFADGFGERDGDVRWSDDKVYADPDRHVRLFKLHGSIEWYLFQHEGRFRAAIFQGPDIAKATNGAGKPLLSQTATPSFLSGINTRTHTSAESTQIFIFTFTRFCVNVTAF